MPDAVTLTESSSSATAQRTVTSDWRARRSVSRIRYGRKTVEVMRLDDGRACFGRRMPPAPGHSQIACQRRKVLPLNVVTARVPGTTVSASDMVSKKTKDKLELRKKIRDMIQAGRPMSTPASARAASSKASPRQRTPVGGEQVVSAAAVLQSMSSVEERTAADRVRPANLARLSKSSLTGPSTTTAL